MILKQIMITHCDTFSDSTQSAFSIKLLDKHCFAILNFFIPFLIFQVNDEEVESILPAAAYALAKIHMHLVISG